MIFQNVETLFMQETDNGAELEFNQGILPYQRPLRNLLYVISELPQITICFVIPMLPFSNISVHFLLPQIISFQTALCENASSCENVS